MFPTGRPVLLAALALGVAASPAVADDSAFDRSFAGDGISAKELPGDAAFLAVDEQPDGRVVAAGWTDEAATGGRDLLVTRVHATGRLDGSFGTSGRVRTPVGAGDDEARAIEVLPDGKILVAGRSTDALGRQDVVVARYTAAGDPDPDFSDDGVAIYSFNADVGVTEAAEGIAITSAGKVVIGGQTYTPASPRPFTLRLTANGGLDASYCGTGACILGIANTEIRGMTAGPGTTVLLAGSSGAAWATRKSAVLRVDAAGALDEDFAGDGVGAYDVGSVDERLQDVAVGTDGSVVATGSAGGTDVAPGGTTTLKLTSTGLPDTGFGGGDGGLITRAGPLETEEVGEAVEVDPEGRIVVAGLYAGPAGQGLVLTRRAADGTPDASFAGDGSLTVPAAQAMAFDAMLAGDRIVAAGMREPSTRDAALFAFADRTPPPVTPAPVPPQDEPAVPPAPATSPRSAADPLVDRTAPKLSRVALGTRVLTTRSSLRFTVSEAARVTVVLERRSGARRVKARTIVKRVPAGRGSIRLAARGLRRGRHVVRVMAVDAAGNRSAERRLSLRVAR